jgi:hypothetical protein
MAARRSTVKTADHTANTGAEAASRSCRTFGEIFPDGSVLELVASAAAEQPDLLLWDGTKISIASEIEHLGQLYRPEKLHCSILRATRFSREPLRDGTIRQLFTELAGTFEKYLAFSKPAAERTALWVLSTWFSDCLSSPPVLWISGADIGRAASFLGLLHSLCRRAMKVAGINRAGFLSLPMSFRPTLLVNQPSLSAGIRNLWRESNYRGLVVPGSRGAVLDVSSSKAIFMGMAGAAPSPSAEHLHLALIPADREVPPLDEPALNKIAEYFLPRLLQYRLEQAQNVRQSQFTAGDLKYPIRELAGKLGACVQDDTELALRVVPLLLPEDSVFGQCNLDCAIIQVVWPRLHAGPTTNSAARMKIEAELTPEANTLLLSCGETTQYNREEVGIRVAHLELARKRTNGGTILLLGSETNRRIHQLARSYGIERSVPGCPYCQPEQKPAE